MKRVRGAGPRPPGRLLAEFSTRCQAASRGPDARWTTLRIRDAGHGWLHCEKIRGPEPLELDFKTVASVAELKRFFGSGWVARELLADLDPLCHPRWRTAA